jgi:macrolide transport system ATP-binding/permease protein
MTREESPMATLREWVNRLWGMLGPGRKDRELEEELRLHLELAADDERRRGHSPEGAERAARIRAGSVVQAMEALREQRGLPWFENLARDLRYACRMLAKNPGFTVVSVLSLAIGIGANCAVFSWADALLLRPLTVPHANDVLIVGSPRLVQPVLRASYPDYLDLRDRNTSFEGLVAYTRSTVAFATGSDVLPRLRLGMLVSGNLFTVMGIEPRLGRGFRPEEDQVPGRDTVVILGHEFWERQFGADPSVLGRTVRLNGIDFTVVGVAPPGFTGLDQFAQFDFYTPLMMWPRLTSDLNRQPLEARDLRDLIIKGRLKAGVTMSQAQTELSAIAEDLKRAYPDTNQDQTILVRTELQARIVESSPSVRVIALLTLLAGAVLFVACANVAGLLTSRAPLRAREIALRLALGAGRARVLRQLITESVLMTLIGGVLGLVVGYAGVTLFRQFRFPTDLPVSPSFELDWRAMLVSLVVALASAVLCGLIPAVQSTRADLTAVMKATDAAGVGRRRWGRAVLVAGQVAASVVVLVVATFVFRGTERLLGSGPGYRTDHVLIVGLDPGLTRYNAAQAQRFFEQVAERARLVPGVKSAALISPMPMDGTSPVTIVPEGFEFPPGKENVTPLSATVDEHYFHTMELPILKGRGFLATDTAETPKVAIVNELLAGRYWPGEDPVGKRFRLDDSRGPLVEIVGLAKTTKYTFIMEAPLEFVYFPYRQRPEPQMVLLTESLGDPSSLVTPLREVVRGLDRNQAIYNVRTMDEYYRIRVITVFYVVITIIAAMGVMGLVLSMVGLYGLVAYAVSRRTREIGIRMAIGAARSDVLLMVLRQGLVLAVAGLGIGLLVSIGAERAMAAAFPGGPSRGRIDFGGLVLVAAGVLAVTFLAALVPAHRASRVNPTEALRHE